jgi:hypothetical protein
MNEWGNAELFILLPPLLHYQGIIKYLYPILENLSHIIFIVKFYKWRLVKLLTANM